jgi:hypothetical protein
MAKDLRETHVWHDGLWHVYTERPVDRRHFTAILGPPHETVKDGQGWWWRFIPENTLSLQKPRTLKITDEDRAARKVRARNLRSQTVVLGAERASKRALSPSSGAGGGK